MVKGLFKGSDSRASLVRLSSLLAIALGIFGLVIGAVVLYASMQGQLASEQASRAASDQARNIADALGDIQSTLRDPQVQDLARQAIDAPRGRSETLEQAVRRRGVTNIIDLRVFPASVEEIPLGEYPEPDFTVIEMLIEARRDGQATIQVHYAGTSNENLAFAQSVSAAGEPAGVLFLRVPVSMVNSLLQPSPLLDSVALVQGSAERSVVLKSIGTVPASGSVSDIPDSRLALRWSRVTLGGPMNSQSAIIVGSIGILLLMGGLLIRQRSGVLDTARSEPLEQTPSEPVAQARAESKKPKSRPRASVRPRPSERAAPPAAADLPDWLLDSDEIDQKRRTDDQGDPARDEVLADLPDTLADEKLTLAEEYPEPEAPPEERSSRRGSRDTLVLDPDERDLFEPDEDVPDLSEHRSDTRPGSQATHEADPDDESLAPPVSEVDDEALDLSLDQAAAELEQVFDADEEDLFELERPDQRSAAPEQDDRDGSDGEPDADPASLDEAGHESSLQLEQVDQPADEPADSGQPGPDEPSSGASEDRPPLIDPALFRATNIGGVVEDSLDARSATMIGQAIGSEARARGVDKLVVGRDGRLYGAVLMSALSQGLRAAGVQVIDIGAVPIPVLNFAASELAEGSGVMVTGSHYPPEHNGFRIRLKHEVLHDEQIMDLFRRIQEQDLTSGQGDIEEQSIVERYVERIGIDIQLERPLKVVVDCGNGIGGTVIPEVLTAIGADVIPLYADVDGNFPNHHPNPADPENLEDLKLCVRNFQADLGLAYDGDGDRLGLLDSKGDIVWLDHLLMLLARDILERHAGGRVVMDAACSDLLRAAVEEAGGSPVIARSADAFVEQRMREEQAVLGGLFSGHLFIAERWYPFDDAIYASARLLELLAADTRSIDEILAELPDTEGTPELRVALEGDQALDLVTALIAEGDFGDGEVSTVDGLRVDFADGWGLIRPSHTSPDLVLRFEGRDAKALNRIKTLFKKQIKARDADIRLLF